MTPPTITPLGDNRYRVTDGDGARLVFAAVEGARVWVFLDGQAYVVEPAPIGRRGEPGAHADDLAALVAPMPATVTGVRVDAGQRVTRGDVLLTLEAMKMELPVVAPRDGVVRSVLCRPGDMVLAGARLVELD